MGKILEVIVIFFFMIGFLSIMGIIINYCVDLWFEQPKEMESRHIGYSEEDMKKCWDACISFNKPSGLDSGVNFKNFMKQLKKK